MYNYSTKDISRRDLAWRRLEFVLKLLQHFLQLKQLNKLHIIVVYGVLFNAKEVDNSRL